MIRSKIGYLFLFLFLLPATFSCAVNLRELVYEESLPETLAEAGARVVDTPSAGLIRIETLLFTPFTWQGIEWQNHLLIIRPPSVQSRVALIFITGDYSYSEDELAVFRLMALQNRAYVAVLFDVPNQPLFGGKREDWLISHTFLEFLRTGDPRWPALVPMVESTVVSMNLIQDYATSSGDSVEGFVLSGGSKRGWTTWLTAAIDERVEGIVPIAYDNLNLADQMRHQIEFWGSYSRSIREYVDSGILNDFDDPNKRELLELVDPFTYRDSLDLPKLIVVGTNDPYWPVDAANLYIYDLPGYSGMVYAPNAGHGTEVYRVTQAIQGMISHLNTGLELPSIEIFLEETASNVKVRFNVDERDSRLVELRFFHSLSTVRDFRKAFFEYKTIGKEEEITVDKVSFNAFYIEGVFTFNGKELLISTPVKVIEAP